MDLLGESEDTTEVHPPTLASTSGLPADVAVEAAPAHAPPLSTWIAASAVALLLAVVVFGQLRGSESTAAAELAVPAAPTPADASPALPAQAPAPPAHVPAPTAKSAVPAPPSPVPAPPKPTAAPAAPEAPVPVPAPVPAPAAPPVEAKAAPPAEPAVSTGVLRVLTSPPTAMVWIDGVQQGPSPRKVEAVEPGHHQVRVALGEDVGSFLVEVKAGGDTRWCYTFATRAATPGACPR
jgi:outer membrane biosynthesis protein TonB